MLEDLEATCRGRRIDIEVVDVDGDPDLVSRYGMRVPVLVADGLEICEGQLDSDALARYLAPGGL